MCIPVSKGSPLSIALRGFLSIFLLFTVFSASAQSNPPLNVQGRVLVDGLAFNGAGKFKFALVSGNGTSLFWTHDATSVGPNFQPTNFITLNVIKGLYSVLLGDPSIPGMTNPLTPAVFTSTDVRLRTWFDDGTHGFQQLSPDQRLAAVGYAYKAQSAAEAAAFTGSISLQQLPAGLLTNKSSGVDLTGSFTGDGSGLIGIRGSTPFQIADAATNIAVANTGYLITNASQRIVVLPATATLQVGDVVRIAGPGSWKVAQNTNQSVIARHFRGGLGASWIAHGTARNWTAITTSTNGVNMAAVVYGQLIYLSADGGVTWAPPPVSPSKTWLSIASSADGQRLVAGTDGEFLYISSSTGQDWSSRSLPGARSWTGVASSHDGTNLVAVSWNVGPLYTSPDAGDTWVARGTAGNRNWTGVACSADGYNIIASSSAGAYVSHDRGATWASPLTGNFTAVACSSDGQRMVAGLNASAIYTSSDAGANWVKRDASGLRSWRAMTCSADGSIVAATSPDGISISVDGGGAWAVRAGARDWRGITCSQDAGRIAAASFGNFIYTSESISLRSTTVGVNGFLAGGESSAVELQHVGNGRFFPLSSSGDVFAY